MSYGIEVPEADYADTIARLAAQGAPAGHHRLMVRPPGAQP